MTEKLIICTFVQSFDSVAPHLELAILSRKFRITEHLQSSVVEYFNFFLQKEVKLARPAFSPGSGYKMLQKQVIY